jgi:hypothetical protein
MVSDSELTVKASDLEVTQALMQQRRMKAFEAGAGLTLGKSLTIRGGGALVWVNHQRAFFHAGGALLR